MPLHWRHECRATQFVHGPKCCLKLFKHKRLIELVLIESLIFHINLYRTYVNAGAFRGKYKNKPLYLKVNFSSSNKLEDFHHLLINRL